MSSPRCEEETNGYATLVVSSSPLFSNDSQLSTFPYGPMAYGTQTPLFPNNS